MIKLQLTLCICFGIFLVGCHEKEDEGIDEVVSFAKKGKHKPLFLYIAGRERPFKKSDIVMIEDLSKIGEAVKA